MKSHHILILYITVALFATTQLHFGATPKQKRIVRIGYYELNNFQEYDSKTNQYRGYSYDYLLAIAQYANWQYEFVSVTLDDALKMLQ